MIDCICGFGDDGKHSEHETTIGKIIACPSAPPGMLWGFDDRQIKFLIKNLGHAGGVSSPERDDGPPASTT